MAHADDTTSATQSSTDSGQHRTSGQQGQDQITRGITRALNSLSAPSASDSNTRTASRASNGAPRPFTSVARDVTERADPASPNALGAAKRLADGIVSIPRQLHNAANALRAAAANPSTTALPITPADAVATPYGDIGKWQIEPDGSVSDWGGQPYMGNTLIEPVNIIIVDPTSTTPEQSTKKLNRNMAVAGFPAQPIHSTGFMGMINGEPYDQQPDGEALAYSDNLFVLPNNHARAFGPAPLPDTDGNAATSEGYVWSVAASTETPSIYDGMPTHSYVSSNLARNILVLRLLLTGQATFVGIVPMKNAHNTGSETTGDHDGYAVVLALK